MGDSKSQTLLPVSLSPSAPPPLSLSLPYPFQCNCKVWGDLCSQSLDHALVYCQLRIWEGVSDVLCLWDPCKGGKKSISSVFLMSVWICLATVVKLWAYEFFKFVIRRIGFVHLQWRIWEGVTVKLSLQLFGSFLSMTSNDKFHCQRRCCFATI